MGNHSTLFWGVLGFGVLTGGGIASAAPVLGPTASNQGVPAFVCKLSGTQTDGSGILVGKNELRTAFHVVDENEPKDVEAICDNGRKRFRLAKIERSQALEGEEPKKDPKEWPDHARVTLAVRDTGIRPAPIASVSDYFNPDRFVSDPHSGIECAVAGFGPKGLKNKRWVDNSDFRAMWSMLTTPMRIYGPKSLRLTYSVEKTLEQTEENLKWIDVVRRRGFESAYAEDYGPEVQTLLLEQGQTLPHLGVGDSGGGFFCRKVGEDAWYTVATVEGMDLIANRNSYNVGLTYYFVLAVGHKFKLFKEASRWD